MSSNNNHLNKNQISNLLTELKNNKSTCNNLNLVFKLRQCIRQLLDSRLHENDLILNELEIILNRLVPIDLTQTNNDNETTAHLNENDDSSALYFEYSFFRFLKFILSFAFNGNDIINGYRDKSQSNLVELMKYCLSKSIKQYESMQQSKKYYLINEKLDCDDRHDQLNLIELSRNFRINLLNIMHRFKESYNSIANQNGLIESKESSITFYDCMSSLVSIYVDISLDLKTVLNYLTKNSNKQSALKILKFKLKCLTTNLCLNIFYLLDSCIYYVCNVFLLLSNVNQKNLRYLIPILKKIVLKIREKMLNKNKICRSLYLRMLLIYVSLLSKCNHSSYCKKQLEFYKNFLYSIPVRKNFVNYIKKLLNSYSNETNIHLKYSLFNIIDQTSDRNKLRRFILHGMDQKQMNLFLEAIHTKSVKNNPFLRRNLSTIGCIQDKDTADTNNDLIKKENDIILDEQTLIDLEKYQQDQDMINIVESFKINTTYFEQDEEYDIISGQESTNDGLQVLIDRIDFEKFNKEDQFKYVMNHDVQNKNDKLNELCEFDEIRKFKLDAVKYKEIKSRRPSPNRNNISKLNLFRNDEENLNIKKTRIQIEDFEETPSLDTTMSYSSQSASPSKTNEHSLCDSGYYSTSSSSSSSSSSKYYKLNDLVSVMINEDYLNKLIKKNDYFETSNEKDNQCLK